MTVTRARIDPPVENTLPCIGDAHFGSPVSPLRYDIIARDYARLADYTYRLQLGDLTENGGNTATEIVTALAWMDSLGGDRLHVVGNHDMYTPGAGPPYPHRTADAAAAEMGLAHANHVVDLGYADLIIVGPDAIDPTFLTGCYYGPTAQAFLDSALDASTKDTCLIAAHAPLKNTVGTGEALAYRSTDQFFYAASDTGYSTDVDLRAVVADHANAKAWISGHTHSPVDAARIVYPETVGGHTLVNINTSCIAYTNTTREWTDRLITFGVTVEDDAIEVRARDHGAHQWVAIGPERRRVWAAGI